MTDQSPPEKPPSSLPRLGEIGLTNYAPYLMNRIMGRYNASLRDEMAGQGLTTPKMRALAVLSVIEGPLIRELAVYSVVEQSTLSRALDQLATDGGSPHRFTSPGRWVTRKAIWKPQVKNPACNNR